MNRRKFVGSLGAGGAGWLAAGGPRRAAGQAQSTIGADNSTVAQASPGQLEPTNITLHTDFQIAEVDPRIFGGFLEHIGRAVYEGVYHPECSCADEDGFRTDVLGALRRLGMSVIRWPGGDFASGYHWQNGVGPRDQRPKVLDRTWNSIEPNHFGTNEFIETCRKIGCAPMITVNLGIGTPEEGAHWVEYCNGSPGTKYADQRVAHGYAEPHGVKLWCLGNEMDKPTQQGHLPAHLYAIRAHQAANLIRKADRSVELLAAGSRGTDETWYGIPTYLEWDRQVLEVVGDWADYLSIHRYVGNRTDTADFLAITNTIDRQIEEMDAACRFTQGKRHSKKRTYLSMDEWNVWYRTMGKRPRDHRRFAPHLYEEEYNLEDALVVAGFFNSFIRHADVLKIAAMSMIANVIAPITTRGDEMLVQSIFYPFEMISKRREGVSLQPVVKGPKYEATENGEVNYIDTSAILGDGRLHLFTTNRSQRNSATAHVDLADRKIVSLESAEVLTGPDAKAGNSFAQPDVVRSRPFTDVEIAGGRGVVTLPPLSFAAMTFRLG